MRKKEIEENLNIAISNSVPDVLDNILAKCEEKKFFENEVKFMNKEIKKENKNRFFMSRLAGVLAIGVLCIGGWFGFNQYNEIYRTESIIEFDVNPSVELKVNKDEEIIKVVPLNKDGEKILEDMDFVKVDLDVAVNAIIGSMLKNGYITDMENSILVSVKNDDVNKANKLKEKLSKEIEKILNDNSIDGSILSQTYDEDKDLEKLARDNDLSDGKAKLINKILDSNIKDNRGNAYTFDSLSKLSINELNLLLSAKNVNLEDINTTGTASEKSYIGKDKAKEVAFSNAKVSENEIKNLEIELDCDDGKLVYEIEFKVSNTEYDYEIDAKTGNILNVELDKDDGQINSNNTNSSYRDDYDDYDDDDDHDD